MRQPQFFPNECVVINDEAEVEEALRGIKCQVRDFNIDQDEYQLYIIDGKFKGQYIWVNAKHICSLQQFRLMQTIDKKKYEQYVNQMEHARKVRDSIFKIIYGVTKETPVALDFKVGMRVRVRRNAIYNNPWNMWTSEMDRVLGEYGYVTEITRKYNSKSNEYEDLVKVEFNSSDLFSDYLYSYHFLPVHLEIQN
jgi:hypothetical protein